MDDALRDRNASDREWGGTANETHGVALMVYPLYSSILLSGEPVAFGGGDALTMSLDPATTYGHESAFCMKTCGTKFN